MRTPALLCAVLGLLCACASMTPAPRYTHAPQSQVLVELEKRRRADDTRLLRVVEEHIGVPYKWGGSTRSGMDCSAFARAIVRETYGIELPRTSRQMYGLGQEVNNRASLVRGDLVFFRDTASGKGISHVGIYVGNGLFAHSSPGTGGTLTPLEAPYYRARYAGARRIRL